MFLGPSNLNILIFLRININLSYFITLCYIGDSSFHEMDLDAFKVIFFKKKKFGFGCSPALTCYLPLILFVQLCG